MAGAKAGKYLELSGLAVMYVEFLKGSVRDYLKKWAKVKSQQAFKVHAVASIWKFIFPFLEYLNFA